MDGTRVKMPGKQARALCPVCREAMLPDETECLNCGAFVIDEAVVRLCRAFGIDREKALQLFEAGFRHPTQLKDRNVDDVIERRESGLLFLCTNCGGFVAAGDTKCLRCEAEFEAGEEEGPARAEEEGDILDLVLCPNCGADNDPEEKECEICGESLRPTGTKAPPAERPSVGGMERPVPLPGHNELEKVDLMLDDLEPTKLEEKEAQPSPPRAAPSTVVGPAEPTESATQEVPQPQTARPAEVQPKPAPKPLVRPQPHTLPGERRVRSPVAKPVIPRTMKEAPRPSLTATSLPRQIKRPVEIRVTRPRRSRAPRTRTLSWSGPPAEFMGPAVVASAVGLFASRALGQPTAAWAIAFALAAFSGYAIAASYPSRIARLGRMDVFLLAIGACVGWIVLAIPSWFPGVSPEVLSLLMAATALPLAWATRRILRGPARALLAAAGGIPLIALAVAAGQGLTFIETPAWSVGLVAATPWPLALAVAEVRSRVIAQAARRELLRAEQDYARQDYTKSLEDYDRAIALSEKGSTRHDLPWYGKGATLVLLGQYEEAIRAIDRALDINPRNEVAWVNKGNALTKMGHLVDSLRCFNAAIKVNPGYEVAWNNKGNALARLGRFEDALRCYEKALEIDAAYRGAWVNKGYVLAKLGRYDEAAACADRVLALAANERFRPE